MGLNERIIWIVRNIFFRFPTVSIKPVDFFTGVVGIREKFGQMVNCAPEQVAFMPSVSYGMNS